MKNEQIGPKEMQNIQFDMKRTPANLMLVPRLLLKEIMNLSGGLICNGTKEGITSWKGPMTKC